MAKSNPTRTRAFTTSTVHVPTQGFKSHRRLPKGTLIALGLFVVLHLIVLFLFTLADRRLPAMIQRLVAVADAALAAAVVMFAVTEFGKKLPQFTFLQTHKKASAQGGAAAAFLLVLGLWFTPLAPIKIGVPAAEDVANWLGNEAMVVTLVLPDPLLPVVALPTVPRQALNGAAQIPLNDQPYAQAMKAIAEGRFGEAEQFLDRVEKSGGIEPQKLNQARGQLALFSGRVWDAPPWFEKAAAAAPSDLGLLCQSAAAWAMTSDYGKALDVGQQLLQKAEADPAQANTLLPVAWNLLAAVKICQGNFKDADAYMEKARGVWEKLETQAAGAQAAHIAASRNNLAVMYAMQPGKLAGAENQLRAAGDEWRRGYGGELNSRAAGGDANLAMIYLVESKFVQAERKFDEALVQLRSVAPVGHPSLAVPMIGQGELALALGRINDAQKLAQETHDSVSEKLPLLTAAQLRLQAMVDLVGGHYIWANNSLGTAAQLAHGLLPADHPFFVSLMATGAKVDVARGDYQQAERICKQAADLTIAKLGKGHPELASIYNSWGQACARQGRRTDAQRYFEQARGVISSLEKELHTRSLEQPRLMAGLVLLSTHGNWRDNVTELHKAIALESQMLAPEAAETRPEGEKATVPTAQHPDIATYTAMIGQLYLARGSSSNDLDQAISAFQQALTMREAQLDANHPEIASLLEDYSAALEKRGKTAEAEEMKRRAERIRAHISTEGERRPQQRPAGSGPADEKPEEPAK